MKYLPFIFRNLFRKKTRTLLTIGSIAVALFLFGGKRCSRCVHRDRPQLVNVLQVRGVDAQRHVVDAGLVHLQVDPEDPGTRRSVAELEDTPVLPTQHDDRFASQ